VAGAVQDALANAPSLYAWAAARPDHDVFQGRGAAFGVRLGDARAVVRHAHRGGVIRFLSRDRFLGHRYRFLREIDVAHRLAAAGIPTPAVLAGVAYLGPLSHTADVATQRLAGMDLAAVMFGPTPPIGDARRAVFEAVGRTVRRLHAAGFVHPDLQLRNVLVTTAEPTAVGAEPGVAFLDVDTCYSAAPDDRRAQRANLRRFMRSWDKWNAHHGPRLAADDRAAFFAAYDSAAGR